MSRGDRDGWNGSWSRPGIITSIMAMIRRCICETLEWCSHFGTGCSEPTADPELIKKDIRFGIGEPANQIRLAIGL